VKAVVAAILDSLAAGDAVRVAGVGMKVAVLERRRLITVELEFGDEPIRIG